MWCNKIAKLDGKMFAKQVFLDQKLPGLQYPKTKPLSSNFQSYRRCIGPAHSQKVCSQTFDTRT